MRNRATRAEQEARISKIHALLISGSSRQNICQFASEKTTWGLTPRSISRLIAAATKLIRSSAAFDREHELGLAIAQLKDIYAKTARVQDFKTALAARRELNELLGLYAPQKVALTDPDGKSQSFIAIFPAQPSSREEWSRQCQEELKEREKRRDS